MNVWVTPWLPVSQGNGWTDDTQAQAGRDTHTHTHSVSRLHSRMHPYCAHTHTKLYLFQTQESSCIISMFLLCCSKQVCSECESGLLLDLSIFCMGNEDCFSPLPNTMWGLSSQILAKGVCVAGLVFVKCKEMKKIIIYNINLPEGAPHELPKKVNGI